MSNETDAAVGMMEDIPVGDNGAKGNDPQVNEESEQIQTTTATTANETDLVDQLSSSPSIIAPRLDSSPPCAFPNTIALFQEFRKHVNATMDRMEQELTALNEDGVATKEWWNNVKNSQKIRKQNIEQRQEMQQLHTQEFAKMWEKIRS